MAPYSAGDKLLIEHDYDREEFIDGAQEFVRENLYPAKIVSYREFQEFLSVNEAVVPVVEPEEVVDLLEEKKGCELSMNLRLFPGGIEQKQGDNIVLSYEDGELQIDAGIHTGLSVSELAEQYFGIEREEG